MIDHNHSWPPPRQQLDNTGWISYDNEKPHRTVSKNWLASLFGSKDTLPVHNDEKRPWGNTDPTVGPTVMRLKALKRSLMRRLPSVHALWSQRTPSGPHSLTQSLPSSIWAVPSADTVRFVLLCGLWYTSSALSSNTGKSILTLFRYPITLTFIQFGFVAGYCLLFMSPLIQFSKLRMPTKAILHSTLPMGVFQVGGHIFSSMAISRIHVSTVHTIKALSPLFTVAVYALMFGVSYSAKTYLSLLPLTFGVMLACSFDMSASNAIGLLCAFGSAIVFVTSNIFFKKIMPSNPGAQSAHKLDKLNLLFYSSGMAFLLMIPIWMFYDLPIFLSAASDPNYVSHPPHGHPHPHSVIYYFIANGTVHFAQNIIAFIILASTSPVTYSIASLIKRVAVICISIAWFAQSVHPVQAFGIGMTFIGLYMYNNAKSDVEKGEHKMRRVEAARELMLPRTRAELDSSIFVADAVEPISGMAEVAITSAYGRPRAYSYVHPRDIQIPPPPQRPSHQPHRPPSYSQTHPSTNLHIKITPPSATKATHPIISPVDSYPSPPASLDSPPLTAVPHADASPWMVSHRSGMTTGHPPHALVAPATRTTTVVA
ncbi:putative transporter C83.11 [Grifola frondosa]|uniref:Putative transporter C83.11 n=1 Tax=Grifola frondosa TaxID=5627 RepID=A0A1C7MAV4_GRIFR|nr:putative transporter C83.11 [Grifola frondosa]